MPFTPLFFVLIIIIIILLSNISSQTPPNTQSRFFNSMKKTVSGDSLSNWDPNKSYCNYTGISCDDEENIIQIDFSGWSLSGKFPQQVCSYLPRLKVLRLGHNHFVGEFPRGIINCSFLQELNLSSVYFTGSLPDFSPFNSLKILDLSYNNFSGNFPALSITNLTTLQLVNLNENTQLTSWELPTTISAMSRATTLILASCNLRGTIPPTLGNISSLIDLELTGNYLTGRIPTQIGLLKNLEHLELYYNQLEGEIPWEIGNLTNLRDLDMSFNNLSAQIPESICMLPNLKVFQLYTNNLVGEIPSAISNSTTLNTLSLYQNFLKGEIPQNLGRSSAMEALDLSENLLSGRLPDGLCSGGKLNYLLVLQNMFSGEIPASYAECKSLVRFRVSSNNLEGEIPEGIFNLPLVSMVDVGYNNLKGSIGRGIRDAGNLSQLLMQGNRISGFIPAEIGFAMNLVKIDLSNNLLSGGIPSEIGRLRNLNILMLQDNMLTSSIPDSLSCLKSLNVLDLSSNSLTGKIPESLTRLLPNSLNFSNNNLSGEIPFPFVKGGVLESFSGNANLCVPTNLDLTPMNISICPQTYKKKKIINCYWIVAISVGILILGATLFLKQWFNKERHVVEHEELHTLSSSFFSYDVKSFHRLSFDQREIIEAMVDKNIVGYGGSGTVYKIELNNGEVVAVKRLWSQEAKDSASDEQLILYKELKTEVETLGSIRHKNIVKLYCYFSSVDCNLLVYEYMANGNLWDALHGGKVMLDWPRRHLIALGVAQGLAYLHHDIMPPIIHRDIKSTNILLDDDYLPKVADFGIAKVLQARGSKDSTTTTAIAGTYGYLAPEYAYSSKATNKCDVYSFGVVLMELVTGKKAVEAEFGESKNIIYWVSTKGAEDVLDKRVLGSYKEDMVKVLRIAIRCTCKPPTIRPTMNEVVQQLIQADPCKFDCCNLTSHNQTPNPTKPTYHFDL
ncbi:hypothetical protein ACS0TY_023761 [Phlomoides rotata]